MTGRFTDIPRRLREAARLGLMLPDSEWLAVSGLMESAALKIEALEAELGSLKEGRTLLLPISRDHADKMVLVGEAFLKPHPPKRGSKP